MGAAPFRAALEARLARSWWRARPDLLAWLLWPLTGVYRLLARLARRAPEALPVPVVVVGNLVVGGAGKTPTVIALVSELRRHGWRPGVVSRGHGRAATGVSEVRADDRPEDSGDEPLLIRRRTGVPVWVGRERVAAARALLQAQPAVNLIVSDDGLQHGALPRQVELVVFDERGVGNGWVLPAGPLRQPLRLPWPPRRLALYNATCATTAAPGPTVRRGPGPVQALAAWHRGSLEGALDLSAFRGRRVRAVAGIAAPERFFSMLESAGLAVDRQPLPDHHAYTHLPWPPGTPEVLLTEKDAVKIDPERIGTTAVWVVALDFELPTELVRAVLDRLGPPP